MALEAAVCHTVDPLAQTALLANVPCNESLVWFKVSVFCYTINTRPLFATPLRYPAVAVSQGDPAASVPKDQLLHHETQQLIDGGDLGMG